MSETFVVATDLLAGKTSHWSNLGYWQNSSTQNHHINDAKNPLDYEIACRNLAHWVGQGAKIGKGQKILDLCVGRGGSVVYWLQHKAALRVDAIEISSASITALRTLAPPGLGLTLAANIEDPALYSQISAAEYDAVICLDAFYHLQDPSTLWRLAAHALKPGGYLSFCTLLKRQEQVLPPALRLFLTGARVQNSTLLDTQKLEKQMQAHGFLAPTIKWGTSEVLAGFADFVTHRAPQLEWQQRLSSNWLKITATAKLARAILREASLGYAAIAARRS